MNTVREPDPNDWRTWERDGRRIFPPEGTTDAQAFAGWRAFSRACWGVDRKKPRRDRRKIIRILKQVDGRYVQVQFARSTERGLVDVRVRGGCRS